LEDRVVPTLTLSNPGTQNFFDGDSVNLSLTAQNSYVHSLSYSGTNLPADLAVSNGGQQGGTGHAVISGTLSSTADQGGPFSVTVTATDTVNNAQVSQTFTLKVARPTLTLTQPNDQTNCDGDTVSLHVAASDNAQHTLTYSVTGLPAGPSINATTGLISGPINSNDALQNYSVTVTATDSAAHLTASKTFNWTLVAIEAVLSNPGDQFNYDGDAVNLTIVAKTSYASAGIFSFSATGLPSSLSLNNGTGVISGEIGPTADSESPYPVTVSVTDSSSHLNASQNFNWTVYPLPVAVSASLSVEEGESIPSIDLGQYLSGGDGVPLAITIVSKPTQGQLTYNGDGTYAYTAPTDWTGADSFTFQGSDQTKTSNTATVTINVSQYAPLNSGGGYSVIANQTLPNINFAPKDSDANGDPTQITIMSGPSNGALTPNSDGTYDYTPTANYIGTDAVTVSANGGSPVVVPIEITDQAPVVPNTSFSTLHDQSLTTTADGSNGAIGLLASAYDTYGNPVTVTAINGTPVVSGQPLALNLPSGAALTVNSDGSFTYVPLAGQVYNDTFTFAVSDGAMTTTAMATVAVTDNAPTAQDETYFIQAGQTLSLDSTGGLLHDAYDADGDSLTVQVTSGPSSGVLDAQPNGSLTYTPTAGFTGTDAFSYRVFDGAEYSGVQQVTIQVQDQAPVASPNTFNVWTAQGVAAGTYNVLTGATSPDNNPLTAVLVSGPQYAASFSLNADGTFTYVPMGNPPSGFDNVDSFEIMANDGTLNSEPVTVTLNWTSTPVAQDDSYLLDTSGDVSVSAANGVLANDFNPMQQIVGAQLAQGIDPSIGTLNFNQDGSFNFTAGANFQGIASFTYQDLIQVGNLLVPVTTATVRLIVSSVIASTTSLTSVNFNGNATITDDFGNVQEGPQYLAPVPPDGDAPAQSAVEWPISFTMGTAVSMAPVFTLSPTVAPIWAAFDNNILVRATTPILNNDQIYQLGYSESVHMTLNAQDQLTTGGYVTTDNLLSSFTAYYPSLNFNWQISPDNGLTWITPSVATSTNPMYVTLGNPNGWDPNGNVAKPQIPVSDLYIGTEGANGGDLALNNASLLTNIWSAFEGLRVTSAGGVALQYFGGWISQSGGVPLTTANALLAQGNGVSSAWAQLFVDVLRAWGDMDATSSGVKTISPVQSGRETPTWMMIGGWTYNTDFENLPDGPNRELAGLNSLGFRWYNQVNAQSVAATLQTMTYQWAAGTTPVVSTGAITPGQNNSNPPK
jgi:hypothetical protein